MSTVMLKKWLADKLVELARKLGWCPWPGEVTGWSWSPRSSNGGDPQGSDYHITVKLFNGEFYRGQVYPSVPVS